MPTGNLNPTFTAPPVAPPPGQDVQVKTYADETKENQPQMPPVYYGGKAGSTAFLADKLLTGWLAGTKMAHERKAKQMADEVGAAKTGLDYIGQAYRAAVESGDPKHIEETKRALSEAYNDYLNKAEKYAIPEADGKKKSTGGKIKEGLKRAVKGGDDPHLNIAHSTLDIMRKTDPTQLYGPSKQEQQQSKLLDLQTSEMEKEKSKKDRWESLHEKDQAQWTPQDRQFNEYYEYERFGKTKEQQTKDELLTKISGGGQLSDQERQLAEQFGFVKPKVVSSQIRTVDDGKGNPKSQIVSIGPDGKLVGTQDLPGKDYVGPNQAQLAGQVVNAQMSALMKWGSRMHPEWDQKTPEGQKALTTWALTTLYPPAAGTINWADKSAQMDTMNRAIQSVLKHHQKEYKDQDSGRPVSENDDMAQAIMGNVVSTTDDGRYAYMPSLGPGEQTGGSTWYKPWSWGSSPTQTWAGMTREQLNDQERKFQAELRAELKKQNPKMPDSQIDSLVPQMLSRGTSITPPPSVGASTYSVTVPQFPLSSMGNVASMQPPPSADTEQAIRSANGLGAPPSKPGESWYSVTMPNGETVTRSMSPEYVEALKSRGLQVAPAH